MKIIKKTFTKSRNNKGKFDNKQRKYLPRIWYGNYNNPNFKSRTLVIRWWNGYWGLDLTKTQD